MLVKKKPFKIQKIKAQLSKEYDFLQNILSMLPRLKGDDEYVADFEMVKGKVHPTENTQTAPPRARSIAELEERLNKIKSQSNHSIKTKLKKKSLNSKLRKKKKQERFNKVQVKPVVDTPNSMNLKQKPEKANTAKPVFNTDGKLVFSKFDFANVGRERTNKTIKNPKKILENIGKQEEKFRELENKEDGSKIKDLKEKIAWKNLLHKAEGQKVKDDPILLKKSIKKMEQKKKQSKKQWDNRVQSVEQKKNERQKKRQENISKKKKEKKSKVVKAAAKRGRVVI